MKKKKLTSLLLCASMLVTSFPGPVMAEENSQPLTGQIQTQTTAAEYNLTETEEEYPVEYTEEPTIELDGDSEESVIEMEEDTDESVMETDSVIDGSDIEEEELDADTEDGIALMNMEGANVPVTLAGSAGTVYDKTEVVYYIGENGTEVGHLAEVVTSQYYQNDSVKWGENSSSDRYYVVEGNVSIDGLIEVTGTAHLILVDGATLNAKRGIKVSTGNTLYICAQSEGTGKLIAGAAYGSAIGGTQYGSSSGTDINQPGAGNIYICGGNVTASTTAEGAAAIGGASGGSGGKVTICGGNVTATSTDGDGIGGGASFSTDYNGRKGSATIEVSSITGGTPSSWNGIIYVNKTRTLYEDTLTQDISVPKGYKLSVSGAVNTLTIGVGVTLTLDGSLKTDVPIINHGTFINNSDLTRTASVTNHGTFSNYAVFTENGNFTNYGTFTNHSDFTENGDFANQGTLQNNGNAVFNKSISNETNAAITNHSTITFSGKIDFQNLGTVSLSDKGIVQNKGTFTNNGTISGTGSIENSGTFTNDADLTVKKIINNTDATFTNNEGRTATSTVFNNDGKIVNYGSFVNNGGYLAGVVNYGEILNHNSMDLVDVHNYGTFTNNKTAKIDLMRNETAEAVFTNVQGAECTVSSSTINIGILTNDGTLVTQGHTWNSGKFYNTSVWTAEKSVENGAAAVEGEIKEETLIDNSGTITARSMVTNYAVINNSGTFEAYGKLVAKDGSSVTGNMIILRPRQMTYYSGINHSKTTDTFQYAGDSTELDNGNYFMEEETISSLTVNGNVKLLLIGDVTVTGNIMVSKDSTLELCVEEKNAYTMQTAKIEGDGSVAVNSYCTLTVSDSINQITVYDGEVNADSIRNASVYSGGNVSVTRRIEELHTNSYSTVTAGSIGNGYISYGTVTADNADRLEVRDGNVTIRQQIDELDINYGEVSAGSIDNCTMKNGTVIADTVKQMRIAGGTANVTVSGRIDELTVDNSETGKVSAGSIQDCTVKNGEISAGSISNITVKQGTVNANTIQQITVEDGEVTVTDSIGTVNISKGLLKAKTIDKAVGITENKGVIFADTIRDTEEFKGIAFINKSGKLYGVSQMLLATSFTIPEGSTLTIESGKSLFIAVGTVLTYQGTIVIEENGILLALDQNGLQQQGNGKIIGNVTDSINKILTTYVKTDGSGGEVSAYVITADTEVLSVPEGESEGWYVMMEGTELSLKKQLNIQGNINLILSDSSILEVEGSIDVPEGSSLTIYGQKSGTGKLSVTANANHAGIGSGENGNSKVTINGGIITANGGQYGAGIGSGKNGNSTVTINGGTITANGGRYGAGIGSGGTSPSGTSGSTVTINGGTITANGGRYGAGIGNGYAYEGGEISGTVTINGGIITAVGGENGAGIGTGFGRHSKSTVTINGGIITAAGGKSQNGIGDGNEEYWQNKASVTINKGIVFEKENKNGSVYGSPVSDTNWEIPEGFTLTVNEGQCVTIPAGVTLTNKGKIIINSGGQLIVKGTLDTENGTVEGKENIVQFLTVSIGKDGKVIYGSAYKAGYTLENGAESPAVKAGTYHEQYTAEDGTALTGKPRNIGTYTVTVSYQAEDGVPYQGSAEFTISAKPITVEITSNGGTYGGTIIPAAAVLKGCAYEDNPEVTLTYAGTANDGTEVKGTEVPKKAGSYTVTATILDNNYVLTGTTTATFHVARAETGFSVEKLTYDVTYGDKDFTIGTEIMDIGNTMTYESSDPDVATVNQTGTVSIQNAGTATIKVSMAESSNYLAATKEVTVNVAAKQVTLTPDNSSKTYGGEEPQLTYKVEGLVGEDKLSDITVSRAAGEDAGTYQIFVSSKEGANRSYQIICNTGTFTIDPKIIGITWGKTSFVYDGTEKVPAATATELIGQDTCEVIVDGAKVDAGTDYIATAMKLSNSNYALPTEQSFLKKTFAIAKKEITVAITPNGGVVDAVIPATAKLQGCADGENPAVTLTYTGNANDGTEVNGTEVPEKAGSYTVTAAISDNNYELTGTTKATFTVGRASAELSVSAVGDKNYRDADFKLDVTRKGDGVLTYVSSDEKVIKVSENGTVSVIGAGTATITVSLEESANYLADKKEITVTVKKINRELTVSNLTYNVTYGDAAFTIGATADDSESAITYESSDPTVAIVDENGTVSIKNAGEAVINVSVAESSNYNAVAKEVTVNVAAKPVVVTPDNASRTYGEQDLQLIYTADGLVGNDKLTDITLNRETGENVGTYTISASQKDGANRNYKVTFNTGIFTITPKTIGITWGETSFVYDGTEKVPVATATGLVRNDTCDITVTGAKTNAGTDYTARATKISNSNYALPTEQSLLGTTFTIERASAELSVSAVGDKNYRDADFKLDVTRNGDGVLTYVSSDEKVIKVSENGTVSVIGAGSATITVSLEESANYLADTKEITVTVKKINRELTVSNLMYNVTYGDAAFTIGAIAGDSESTITYESSDPNVATVDQNGTVSIKNAGQTTIKVRIGESSNYNAVSKKVTVNVSPKPASAVAPSEEEVPLQLRVVKQTQKTITLTWNRIKGADGYILYGNRCNTSKKKYKMKKLATFTNGNTKTWTHKNLKKGTSYKYCIKAYQLVNGKKKILKTSLTIRAVTTGGKYGTAKGVTILRIGKKKGTDSITLKKGKTAQITARELTGKKPVKHSTGIRYVSGNSKIVSVSASGKIKAKKKGTCYIWVYAQNGSYKKITVKVK